jgi:hypothetical protein
MCEWREIVDQDLIRLEMHITLLHNYGTTIRVPRLL